MSGSIINECYFWIASILTGVCMAFAYDLLRLFRRLIRHCRIAVDLEDILYWTACFIASFTLLYYGNNGVIRFVAVLGAAIGMFIYSVTIGCVFVKISYSIIERFIKILVNMFKKVFKPIKKLLLTVVTFGDKIKNRHKKIKMSREGETKHGKEKEKKSGKKKNTGISQD